MVRVVHTMVLNSAHSRAPAPTNGLLQLLDAFAPKNTKRATSAGLVAIDNGDGGGGGGGGILLLAILHIATAVLLIIGTALAVDAGSFRTNSLLLVDGTLASPFTSLLITNMLVYASFATLSGVDAAFYMCTNATITGFGLGLGLATTTLSGALVVLTSLQCSQTTAFVWLGAFLACALVWATQLATMLSILVKSNSPLLRAIRESL